MVRKFKTRVTRTRKVHQTGRTHIKRDSKLTAKKPGLRRSASGKKYYESRKNRSDVSRRKRL